MRSKARQTPSTGPVDDRVCQDSCVCVRVHVSIQIVSRTQGDPMGEKRRNNVQDGRQSSHPECHLDEPGNQTARVGRKANVLLEDDCNWGFVLISDKTSVATKRERRKNSPKNAMTFMPVNCWAICTMKHKTSLRMGFRSLLSLKAPLRENLG